MYYKLYIFLYYSMYFIFDCFINSHVIIAQIIQQNKQNTLNKPDTSESDDDDKTNKSCKSVNLI